MDYTSIDIVSMLRDRYRTEKGRWAIACEVGNATGSARTRACDFMAMSCWPSSGLHLHGHEIKVSRSDWQTEMQDITKSAAFIKHSHYWWIVAPKGVVKLEELPATWGLLQASNTALRVARPATLNTHPELNWQFAAALLRATSSQSDYENALKKEYSRGYRDARTEEEGVRDRHVEQRTEFVTKSLEELQSRVAAFEKTSGVKIDRWSGHSCGEAFKLARQLQSPGDIGECVDRITERVDKLLAALREVHGTAAMCSGQ